jgi:rhodanese-related sulfurtransferase
MNQMTPAQFAEAIENPEIIVLDVRTPQEYESAHIEGAILIDIQNPDFAQRIAQLDKSAHYAVYCRSGNRSSYACQDLSELGITKIEHLEHGIMAWIDKNYPVNQG